MIEILSPGLQTSVQAEPRAGLRHQGLASGGPADPLSHALANALVGNPPGAPALEATLSGMALRFLADTAFALAGAPCEARLGETAVPDHETLQAQAGQVLTLSPPRLGCRTYLAIAGGLEGQTAFGSRSTDLRAGFGGHEGRALKEGDRLATGPAAPLEARVTPEALRQPFLHRWTLRATLGPEWDRLSPESQGALFASGWTAGRDSDRTGVRLDGDTVTLAEDAEMDSAATLPGTVQCPGGGAPILLLPDCGTTGGYPRAARVIRADRHLLGQIRPGDDVRLLEWSEEDAVRVLDEKTALLRGWLGTGFALR
ncbi:biotin-dependent carboxyltransferase family protein [Parvularcula oceani]|uniref:5-oxoprolinase subunit C family protein n=1 Tax=Parvularcula oceani TaxID=1247963 RepID=UPI00056680B9|nr:biotin-dependent carboxyltransferase family protein [Parvularcula oceani]